MQTSLVHVEAVPCVCKCHHACANSVLGVQLSPCRCKSCPGRANGASRMQMSLCACKWCLKCANVTVHVQMVPWVCKRCAVHARTVSRVCKRHRAHLSGALGVQMSQCKQRLARASVTVHVQTAPSPCKLRTSSPLHTPAAPCTSTPQNPTRPLQTPPFLFISSFINKSLLWFLINSGAGGGHV